MAVTVIGLGKIGLSLASKFAQSGQRVIGVDVNLELVESINSGSFKNSNEPLLEDLVCEMVQSLRLQAVAEVREAVPHSDVVVVAVPLMLSNSGFPDFAILDDVTRSIGKCLEEGTLVLFETTLPIGSTRRRLVPILEQESGMKAGTDFYVAYSPERVYSGRIFDNLRTYPKLVGGVDEESESRAKAFYESVLDFNLRQDLPYPNGVWAMGSSEVAEFTKLAETTYRDVNIALANQFANYAEELGVDVYKVIEAGNSQPYSHIHQPGVAVGGHCIPVYPELYLSTDPDAKLVAEARKVNLDMPRRAVERLKEVMGSLTSKRVLILGLAYRGGVKENAYSGAWGLRAELERLGAEVLIHDPLYSDAELLDLGLAPFHFGENCEGAILQANHKEYLGLSGEEIPGLRVIVDGRNFINADLFPNTKVLVVGIGK